MASREQLVTDFMDRVRARNPGQDAFLQAVEEVATDVLTVEKANPAYNDARVLERLTEPDRVIAFRVVWEDETGAVRINRGWRVQTSNAIGPYKGGIRFHPTVDESILKFLGFEQVLKNALTGLPLGGGKGGADFDPRGCSDHEIMRFCQAYMTELGRHIGPDRDVPAGDINVGTREIGYLFGTYKRHNNAFHGALTGKGGAFGGSAMRTEATGYGLIYFVGNVLAAADRTIEGQRVAISGKGNVATHAARKAIDQGAIVVSLSDTTGALVAEDGFTHDAVTWVQDRKASGEDIAHPPKDLGLVFREGALPWQIAADIALPCATQNEMDADAAKAALDAGVTLIAEGANMPLTAGALRAVDKAGILYAPGKAANAGGVAISGLEMSQNAHRRYASAQEGDSDLRDDRAAEEGREAGRVNYRRGANIAGYRTVADAIVAYGVI